MLRRWDMDRRPAIRPRDSNSTRRRLWGDIVPCLGVALPGGDVVVCRGSFGTTRYKYEVKS